MRETLPLAALKITQSQFQALAPKSNSAITSALAASIGQWLTAYGIDTPLRVAHFMAQAAHETAGFKTLVEYGGEAYFNKSYGPGSGPGKRLGNTKPGDGARFKGRGIFQCTGRDNYAFYGRRLGLDLISNPDLAADAVTSIRIACEYWNAKGCSALADRDDIEGVTRKINGGRNGLADRKAYLAKAKQVFAKIEVADPATVSLPNKPPIVPIPDAAIATGPAPSATTSPEGLATAATAAGGVLAALSGLSGPLAYAAAGVIVVAAAVAAFYIVRRIRSQPA